MAVTTEFWVVSSAHGVELGVTEARTAGTAVAQVRASSNRAKDHINISGGAHARRLTDREVLLRGLVPTLAADAEEPARFRSDVPIAYFGPNHAERA